MCAPVLWLPPLLHSAFVGLDGSGKTSAIVALASPSALAAAVPMLPPAPSVAVKRSSVLIKGISCTIADVPGHISRLVMRARGARPSL